MRLNKILIIWIIFLFPLYAESVTGTKIKGPSFEPAFFYQDIVGADSSKTGLSSDELIKLCLLFGERSLDSKEAEMTLAAFEKLKKTLDDEKVKELEPENRGRTVLKIIYRDYLKKYSSLQTRLDIALKEGSYNCVSSALLYMAAAKYAGLEVRGQKTAEHAFCTVYIPAAKAGQYKKIDVETTNPYGFNPGSKEEIEYENEIKGYYVVPKTYYSSRREVSDVLFAGLIAGNLCSAYADKNDYEKALPLGAARYYAVSSENTKAADEVRKEFDILAANYVNILPESTVEFMDSVTWYRAFIDRWGMTSFLQNNMDNAVNNLLVLCYEEKNYELAAEGWQQNKAYVSSTRSAGFEEMLVDTLIVSSTDGLSSEEALSLIQGLMEKENLSSTAKKRLELHLENTWLGILNNYMNSRDYSGGYEKASLAQNQLPKSSKVKSMQKAFYNNCIASIHNEFASLANAGKYEEAKKILEEGLKSYPEDKTLKNDLTQLLKRM